MQKVESQHEEAREQHLSEQQWGTWREVSENMGGDKAELEWTGGT